MLAGTLSALALTLAIVAGVHLLAEVAGAERTQKFIRPGFGALVGYLALSGLVSFAYDAAAVLGGML